MNKNGGREILILSKKIGESIVVNGDVLITVLGMHGNQVRLGIDAPKPLLMHNEELCKIIRDELQNKPIESQVNYFYTKRKLSH